MAVQVTGQPKDKAKPKDPPKDKAKAPTKPLDTKNLKTDAKLNTKEVIRNVKKTPKKFEAFQMRDPSKAKTAAGSIVKADFKIKLPDGRMTTAKKYYDDLNALEKKLT